MTQKLEYAGNTTKSGRSWWLPRRWVISLAALWLVLIAITILGYALVRSRQTLTLHTLAEADAIAFTKHFQSEIEDQLRVFRRLKWNYIAGRYKNDELRKAAIEMQKANPFFLEIGEANAAGHVDWVWPGNDSMIPTELRDHEEWWAAVKPNQPNPRDITAVWLDKQSNPRFMALVMPLSVGDPEQGERMLVARVMPQTFL